MYILNCIVMEVTYEHYGMQRVCNQNLTCTYTYIYIKYIETIRYISLLFACIWKLTALHAQMYTVYVNNEKCMYCKTQMKSTLHIQLKNVWPYDLCHRQYPKINFNSTSSQFPKFLLNSGVEQSHAKDQGIKYKQTYWSQSFGGTLQDIGLMSRLPSHLVQGRICRILLPVLSTLLFQIRNQHLWLHHAN